MRHILILLSLLAIAACSSEQVRSYQDQIAAVCATIMPLASFVPSVGIYAAAGCATESVIARLALDPTSLQWLDDLKSKLKG